jgi:GT2 family glycosyltransferase
MVSSRLIEPALISVVVVNFNGERFIKNCLDSLLKTDYPNFEIIVVDNNSVDKSVEILDGFRDNPKIKIVLLDQNLHFAGGNNVGVAVSKGKYVVFLNNDTEVDPNWLSELAKSFQLDENISAVQCLLLSFDGKAISNIGGSIDYCAKLVPATYLWSMNKAAANELRLFFGCGAALGVRRSLLEKIGFFDTDLPTDEVDICWRINLSGGHIILAPMAIVYHFCGGAFGQTLSKQRIFFAETAASSAILKNYEFHNVVFVLPYYVFFFIVAVGADVIVRRRVDLTLFRLKAYIHVMRNLRVIFKKRAQVQTLIRRVSDEELRKLMVRPNFRYFLLNRC